MATGAYEKLEGTKARKFIERLNKAWDGSPFDAERTVVHVRDLSFVNGWALGEAGDAIAMPEKKCVVLDNGRECLPIEYSADFVPAFAANNNVILNADTAADYLRFWLEYTRSGPERFLLVETLDDIPWREEATPQARKSLSQSVAPLALVDHTDAYFNFKACVLFRDTLLNCEFEVTPRGKVTITSRNIIAESLTVIDLLTGF